MKRLALIALALALTSSAQAQPDLSVRLPVTLAMRAAEPEDSSRAKPESDASSEAAGDKDKDDDESGLSSKGRRLSGDSFLDYGSRADRPEPTTLSEKLIFRVNLGFGLDGGQLNCTGGVCQSPPSGISSEGFDRYYFNKLRTYGFGDAVIGTRGIGAPSLNSYFASSFRFDQSGLRSTAVPSVHDAQGVGAVLVRSGYIETDGFFEGTLLSPIYVRAGRQFRYGPAIAHFDGITLGYDSRAVSLGFFSGQRVSLYSFNSRLLEQQGLISGFDARFDVNELKGVPLVLSGAMLFFDNETHFEGGLALRWSRDAVVRASGRILGRNLSSQRLDVRTRLSKTTTVSAELENQAATDWPYDLLLSKPAATYAGTGSPEDPTDPRRYLDFGAQLPRLHLALRAGTVLLDNIDLLLRLGAAIDRTGPLTDAETGDQSGFIEVGAAIEVRLRRALGVGASVLTRAHRRDDPQPADETANPDELPSQLGPIGERSFSEGGITLRWEPGRKSFAAAAELYGRLYDWQSPYIATEDELELRGGGRFSIDAWANENLRMRLEYDVAFSPTELAPEINSIKSLRVITEGKF